MADVTAAEPVPNRRERLRAQTLVDLQAAARRLLVEEGSHAVTLTAVAAEVGMSAPGLYRYVENRDGLLRLVAAAVAEELTATLVTARRSAGEDPLAQTLTLCRTFRAWALTHRPEFTLLFAEVSVPSGLHAAAAPAPAAEAPAAEAPAAEAPAVEALAWAFEEVVLRLWSARQFRVPSDDELARDLRDALGPYRSRLTGRARAAGIEVPGIPLGATYTLLYYWTRVYGLISMEISGHLGHAVADGGPLFEAVLAELVAQVDAG
ncbi:MAG TPA: TetR/AcrR family transcriptional regulator [Mycobacteriales bacterium]